MKKFIFFVFLSYSFVVGAQNLTPVVSIDKVERSPKAVWMTTSESATMRITVEREDMLRFQLSPNGEFDTSLMIERGFLKDDFAAVAFSFTEDKRKVVISTAKLVLEITKSPFSLRLLNPQNHLLTQLVPKGGVAFGRSGNVLSFDMPADEHFYGFGFMRSTFDAQGSKLTWKRGYRWQEATVPFFMSTRNYGFYSNNTWDHEFDFTSSATLETGSSSEIYTIKNLGGQLDFYWFIGRDFKEILDIYTGLTGKSWLVPKASFGLMYRCRTPENQEGLLKIAKTFRDKEIPIDIMALEPGWESEHYGNTWKWSKERFPDPRGMTNALNKMGFRLDLWESGTAPTQNILVDSVQKAWYAQRFPVLDDGVVSFKQDDPYPRNISSQGYDPAVLSNNWIRSGKYGHQELVNVANSIFTETAFKEFRNHTGKRAVTQFHAYNATVASHRWPYQWGGDFSAGNGMLNAGLSGHALTSEDMRDYSPKGLHHDYLTPVPVLDAWAYYKEPWLFSGKVESGHRFYSRLRQKLVPYLYTTLWQSHTKALPMMRPMILEYQSDPNTFNMKGEYMLGDWLLSIADPSKAEEFSGVDFNKREGQCSAYLPAGEWINYWTGRRYSMNSGANVMVDWPDYAGGALLVKAGAILPVGRVNNYTDEHPYEVVDLEVYPSNKSSYTLYEDDGNTYDYEKGEFATTKFDCSKSGNSIQFKSGETVGKYKNMPTNRAYLMKIFSELPPAEVVNRGKTVAEFKDRSALLYANQQGWFYDSLNKRILIKTDSRWRLVKDEKRIERNNTLDLELDGVLFEDGKGGKEPPVDLKITLDSRPVVDCYFESGNLPADGISKTFLHLAVAEVPDAKALLPASSIVINLEGPATFGNGQRSLTVKLSGPQSIPVYSGMKTGIVRISASKDIRLNQKNLIITGKPVAVKVTPLQQSLLADGVSTLKYKVELLDELGNTAVPLSRKALIHLSGEGKLQKGQDTILLKNGSGFFDVVATGNPGVISAKASVGNLVSNVDKLQTAKGKLVVVTNPPEEFVFTGGGYANWVKTTVDVIVKFTLNGEILKSASARPVLLKVYDKERVLKKELNTNSVDGEAIFTGVDYYSRPGKCYFVISSKGYEETEIKIFENTWNK